MITAQIISGSNPDSMAPRNEVDFFGRVLPNGPPCVIPVEGEGYLIVQYVETAEAKKLLDQTNPNEPTLVLGQVEQVITQPLLAVLLPALSAA